MAIITDINNGGPFACFHNANFENLDVETGFPIAESVAGNGQIDLGK